MNFLKVSLSEIKSTRNKIQFCYISKCKNSVILFLFSFCKRICSQINMPTIYFRTKFSCRITINRGMVEKFSKIQKGQKLEFNFVF